MEMTSQWMEWGGGFKKFTWCWTPKTHNSDRDDTRETESENVLRGTVCLVHGLGEHGGRYQSLAEHFVEQGFRVFAFDQQGHGKDHRLRGCIDSYDALLDDITAFLQMAAKTNRTNARGNGEARKLPLILIGHSMGGNLVANHALRRESIADAVIVSSPMLRTTKKISWWFEWLCRTVKLVAPNLAMTSEVYVDRVMSDPEEQRRFLEDQIFHRRLSLRLAGALLDSGRWAISNANRLSKPMLLIHGEDDCLTSPRASEEFAEKAGEMCRLEIMDGFLHDTFRCVGRSQALAHFDSFIANAIQ